MRIGMMLPVSPAVPEATRSRVPPQADGGPIAGLAELGSLVAPLPRRFNS
ncbi:hypothetical protein D8I24_1350 [Cupriavidus necator H850]|nr:hypothetical protein D8I24_1350 [Cupriavidus necator H850]